MRELLTHPYVMCFAGGFLLAVIILGSFMWNLFTKKRSLSREVKKLKESLATKFSIEAESTERLKNDAEEVRKANENLRISVQTLKQKPKRQEVWTLQVYDRTVEKMRAKAPGFAAAWQQYMEEAEQEIDQSLTGKIPFIAKLIRPSSQAALPAAAVAEEAEEVVLQDPEEDLS